MNRYITNFIICVFFSISLNLKGENTAHFTIFNPAEVVEYKWVVSPLNDELLEPIVHNISLHHVGVESREGKAYNVFGWSTEDLTDSYILVREENGAYYSYIETENGSGESDDCNLSGEHLLYDFNMEIGARYSAPCVVGPYEMEGPIVTADMCFMVDFTVADKSQDEYGRRVMDLNCYFSRNSFPDKVFRVVEGIGPLSSGILGSFDFFPMSIGGTYPIQEIEFYRVTDSTGKEIYLNPNERKCGFVKEKEYEWVYAIQGVSGSPEYWKMGFNHYIEYNNNLYRRFTVRGVSDDPDGEWKEKSFKRFLVREQDGKTWLRHTPGLINTDYLNRNPTEESLIYDFRAADGSEIDILTPAGTQSVMVSAGISEIGGENVYSYRFNDGDDVECVEGIGIVKGGILPCVNTVFGIPSSNGEENYSSAVLVAVYDGEGRLIFSQDLPKGPDVSVPTINGFIAPEDRIFNMMGQELDAPLPGQPYIRGGKIRIEPK